MHELMEMFDGYERVWHSAEERKKMVAENMRSLRKKGSLSQKQLSEMLGVSPQAYNGYETGKYEPNIEILIRLCFLYDVDMDYMTSRWSDVNENRELENMAENESKNYKSDIIAVELYQMEQSLKRFKKEFQDLQKRAKEETNKL